MRIPNAENATVDIRKLSGSSRVSMEARQGWGAFAEIIIFDTIQIVGLIS